MFRLIFPAVLLGVLIVDRIAFPKAARRAWWALAGVFALAGLGAVYPEPIQAIASEMGIGRAVDLVLYLAVAILVREFFLSRIRDQELQRELTQLTRTLAVLGAQKK